MLNKLENMLADMIAQKETLFEAPKKVQYYSKHYTLLIGIGNDNTAELTIDEDALKVLCERHSLNFDSLDLQ